MQNYTGKLVEVPEAIREVVKNHYAYKSDWIEKDNKVYIKCDLKSVEAIKRHLQSIVSKITL